MPTIDKLLDKMAQLEAERVVLVSDQPIRLFLTGREAAGPVLASAQLRSMVEEIIPPEQRSQLASKSPFKFSHFTQSGTFELNVDHRSGLLQVTIKPQKVNTASAVNFDNLDFSFKTPSQTQKPAVTSTVQQPKQDDIVGDIHSSTESGGKQGGLCPVCLNYRKPATVMYRVASRPGVHFWLCPDCASSPTVFNSIEATGKLPASLPQSELIGRKASKAGETALAMGALGLFVGFCVDGVGAALFIGVTLALLGAFFGGMGAD